MSLNRLKHKSDCSEMPNPEQISDLLKKFGSNYDDSDTYVNPKELQKAASVFMYLSFCLKPNSGLQFLETLVIGRDKKQEKIRNAIEAIHESYFSTVLYNISKVYEENRYYNWYHGLSAINLPHWDWSTNYGLVYDIRTTALSGSITTQYFGYEYHPDKIEKKLKYNVKIYPPIKALKHSNYTLTIQLQKVSMKVGRNSKDKIELSEVVNLHLDEHLYVVNYSKPYPNERCITIYLERNIKSADIETTPFFGVEQIPGYGLKWHFNEKDLKPDTIESIDISDRKYHILTKYFRRYYIF